MSEEEGRASFAAWMAWMDKYRERWVDDGNPVEKSWTVSKDGIAQSYSDGTPASGYGIIKAASYAEACEIAAGCPDVVSGVGHVEVAAIHVIKGMG